MPESSPRFSSDRSLISVCPHRLPLGSQSGGRDPVLEAGNCTFVVALALKSSGLGVQIESVLLG